MPCDKEPARKRFSIEAVLDHMRLDHAVARFLGISRSKAKELVESGGVRYNGVRVTFGSKKVAAGGIVMIADGQSGVPETAAESGDVPVIYEDEELIVVDKPAGLLTCRSGGEKGRAVTDALAKMGKAVFPVHRLDRETTGVLIFAKNAAAQHDLERQFQRRSVEKIYIGIVEGLIKNDKGRIKGRLAQSGEYGETKYRVIRRVGRASLVEFVPQTGRTHQIRLQLLSMGCCLAGEKKYIPRRLKSAIVFPRAALHARLVAFIHPGTRHKVVSESAVPPDMRRLLGMLVRRSPG